ncbi:LuxR family transcriptional regulator [Mycolicibacterium arabiense]|uniref:LuxR family transcriptional regulator n=1 Tax=Mycolicibacterium arabiense TaxID=1286181 RepID=A0A7I7S538_9MYCO|nr:LuxR family transcriptional regulator [Mycolicibacterium arabiense]
MGAWARGAIGLVGWPVVSRDAEFSACLSASTAGSGYNGAVLVGEAGIGKTTLARSVATALDPGGSATRYVLGTRTGRDLPLAAFSRLLPTDTARHPAAMLAAAHHALADFGDLILVVDDAHYLDTLSALLIQQLSGTGTVRLILTIRAGDDVPDAVSATWKEGNLRRIPIGGLSRAQTADLVTSVLDGEVDGGVIDLLHDYAAGSPLMLRGVLAQAGGDGTLLQEGGVWRLKGPLQVSDNVRQVIGSRLATLDPSEIDLLETVSVAEVVDWDALICLFDIELIDRAERHGAIHVVDDGPMRVARPAHPLIGDVVRGRCGVARARAINGLLARCYAELCSADATQPGSSGVVHRIRLAQFMTNSDLAPDLELIDQAAASALTMSKLDLAETLARFAVDRGGGLASATVLAEALSWQGRGEEAEAVLARYEPAGHHPALVARWGGLRAANLFFACGRADAARSVLTIVRQTVTEPLLLTIATAMEVSFAYLSGDVEKSVALGTSALEDEMVGPAVVWTGMATAGALAMTGRFDAVGPVAACALEASERCESGPQRYLIGMAEMLAQLNFGDFDAAERTCARYGAMASGVPQAVAVTAAFAAKVDLERGRLTRSAETLHRSLDAMAESLPTALTMVVSSWSAQAHAAHGDLDASKHAVAQAEQAAGPQAEVFVPELLVGRAWVNAAMGETSKARWYAIRAADRARRSGTHAMEMYALHTAVRFGDSGQEARMRRLADLLGAPLPAAMWLHCRALADHDGGRLDEAARRFMDIGALALAADAAAHAAAAHARAGMRSSELASASRAQSLARQCGLRSPATLAGGAPLPLTDREREVATLVGLGSTNREIAERLGVSVRTIDGHLYRIYPKLGVHTRDQLARLLAGES